MITAKNKLDVGMFGSIEGGIGWIPATIWVVYALSQYTTDQKINNAIRLD